MMMTTLAGAGEGSTEMPMAPESSDELDEIKRRAVDALAGRNPSYSLGDSIMRARAAVEEIRKRKQ